MRTPKGARLVKRRRKGCLTAYYYRRTIMSEDGSLHRQNISLGSDLSAARAKFAEYLDNPPPIEREQKAEPLTVRQVSERWLTEYVATRRTPRGQAAARRQSEVYLWPHIGAKPVQNLKPADLRALSAALEAAGVGLRTRRRVLEDLRCLLRYAVDEAEVLDRSPWKRGMLPILPEAVPRPLNDLEAAEVLRVAPERWRPVLALMAATGLRWGEVRALRWEDVREKPYPHLVVSRSHDGPTKSRKVREVPLILEAPEVLDGLRGEGRSGPVFSWLPETASWIRRHVIAHSWVKDFHVHRLRHSFASRWLERGGSIEGLQRVLGHSTIKLTEAYGRLRPHVVAAEAARINRAEVDAITDTMTAEKSSDARKLL